VSTTDSTGSTALQTSFNTLVSALGGSTGSASLSGFLQAFAGGIPIAWIRDRALRSLGGGEILERRTRFAKRLRLFANRGAAACSSASGCRLTNLYLIAAATQP
jgi:hypothetical protein